MATIIIVIVVIAALTIGVIIEKGSEVVSALVDRIEESPRGFAILGVFVIALLIIVLKFFAGR